MEQEDSDADDIKRLMHEEQKEKEYSSSDEDGKVKDDDEDEEMLSEDDEDGDDSEAGEQELVENDYEDSSDDEKKDGKKKKSGKKALRAQLRQEQEIRDKEQAMRSKFGAVPEKMEDFERLLVADYDQSYLWIQYMAFMLEKLDAEAARRIAERAVRQISITAEDEKLNIWIAYMNLESKFGTTEQLAKVVKRALEVNDRKKIYLQLINIYRSSDKADLVEDIYKKLCKKYFESLEIWSSYIEFLFDVRSDEALIGKAYEFTEPKTILQRAL